MFTRSVTLDSNAAVRDAELGNLKAEIQKDPKLAKLAAELEGKNITTESLGRIRREIAQVYHPDHVGGSTEIMTRYNGMIDRVQASLASYSTTSATTAASAAQNTSAASGTASGNQQGALTYKVVSGDNLTKIAQTNNTTTTELIRLNPALAANPSLLRINQELILPPAAVPVSAISSTPAPVTTTSPVNPYNTVNIATAEEIHTIVQNSPIGSKPYRIATAGYTAPPSGYEEPTRQFLEALRSELGAQNTGFVTSPTADKGSIDAITTEAAGGASAENLFFVTAKDYVGYINPDNFPGTIDTESYLAIPKYVLPDAAEYSRATAQASNIFVATGGRNATVSDFCNAIEQGNQTIVFNNPSVETPAWDAVKGRVDNASKYLSEQIAAFEAGEPLLYPEVGQFSREFLEAHHAEISRTISLSTTDVSVAAKQAASVISQ
jgi:LysM repeat protein